ncbi:MAG: electron transport complex subunit RsxC [Piscirickettsiaceae bacterium CG_4_9_14_3_um_filter_43_564]|nr:electron transport complex subunit RsxC [Thiomicrospira sp.]OIP96354.1 MAG: electron transporter RnfC [Thiomicrospira sp. CG2_30_44_34]PIQ03090.1 MAG: electron transport complex subunit RsxC [Piscirickettsiaceae bacterium CG18_big_fil_WC_8_21_14_2_50_44_103]PIU39639.1 MAG: electron transport complex subunit RsxC [Piscirickettsiaceae bacterium CG07_land_8_20_14_0_80_44_28]PIW57178.1 MAG: electron transport complex subunit RsxC [Piscirickettsiaceae bacterium CG12_big_fil_rev_8_21_14_0_65_44_93
MIQTLSALKVSLIKWFARFYPMAKRNLYHFHGGIFPQYHKELSLSHPLKRGIIPKILVLPLRQHLGIRTEAKVKVGDRVLKNQCIADTKKGLSAPIHAPTSGKVIAIEPRYKPHPSGLKKLSIVIETDGLDECIDNVLDVKGNIPNDPLALKEIVHRAGIVGMGGAGFPTFAKLPEKPGIVKNLLINGAECEPFITCDDMLMQTHADEIIKGAQIVGQALGIERILFGIEDNKQKAIQAVTKACENTHIEIRPVMTVYPMGGQTQLIQELLGMEVPSEHHAIDVGVLMMNVATLRAIYHAVIHGSPLISRFVTISGLGLEEPFNAEALLGTSFLELAEMAAPKQPINYPLIQGGPMMGMALHENNVPIIKTTNCVLANPPEPVEPVMPCIRCGECMDACPINLLPQQLYWHSRNHEFDRVEKLKVFDCIECGCCSFVCPSHIPLVQYYRHAKSAIKEIKHKEAIAKLAQKRHEFKLERLAREKAERDAKIKAKKAAVKQKTAQSASTKGSASAAAAAKAAAMKQKKQAASESGTETVLSARDNAIALAKKRAQAAKDSSKKTPQIPHKPTQVTRQKTIEADRQMDKNTKPSEAGTEVPKDKSSTTDDASKRRAAAIAAARQKAKKSAQKQEDLHEA